MPDAIYTPTDWYWLVGEDETRLWSSLTGVYVVADDPAYLGWLELGGIATRIGSEAELADVLQPYGLSGPVAPSVYHIPKNLIFTRATDEEAELMDAAIDASGARLRRIYEGATFIATDDPLFGLLSMSLAAIPAIGPDRAAELLAPQTN